MKLLIMQSSPASTTSKCSPHHPVLMHRQSVSFPYCERPSFTPIQHNMFLLVPPQATTSSLFSFRVDSWLHDEIKSRLNSGNACYYAAQNLSSFRLISKNLKIKIHKTVILPLCCMGAKLGLSLWGRNID
jgi:hypothetical protein